MHSLPLKFALALFAFFNITSALAQDSAQVISGKQVYARFCVQCHGHDGKRGEGFQTPIWGTGSTLAAKFGNAQTMIDYMQIMPFNDPALINETQRLAVTAYVLSQHGAIPRNGQLTPQSAATVSIK